MENNSSNNSSSANITQSESISAVHSHSASPGNQSPAQPQQPTLPPSQPPPPFSSSGETGPVKEIRPHGHVFYFLIAIVTLFLGLLIGIYIGGLLNRNLVNTDNVLLVDRNNEITIPADAQKIEECSTNQGALYIRPRDLPQGPVYMVHNSKVVGLEYMIPRDKLAADNKFYFLQGKNIKVDHVNIGPLPHGHAGFTTPHYHIDLFTIDKRTQMNITCAPGSSDMKMQEPQSSNSSQPAVTGSESMQKMDESSSSGKSGM